MPERAASDVCIGLGANLGDRLATLTGAAQSILRLPGTTLVAASALYETEAHVRPGAAPQPDHLNAVLRVETALSPLDLLARLRAIERDAGRPPDAPAWSPRALDLDVLLYGALRLDADELVIPHPRIAERRFVLAPLADVAPGRALPGTGRSVAELLEQATDRTRIERLDTPLIANELDGR